MNRNYTLGLVSVSFRDRAPKEILDAMKKAGLSHIEWGSDVHAPCTDTKCLRELATLQEEYGICCSSYGTYFKFGKTPMAELADYIAAAKILGAPILRLWCGRRSGADMTEEERAELLADCKEAASLAEKEGVILCMECHQKTLTERMEDTLWLMEQVASPAFRMYWQPFQHKSIEENLAYAEAIAPYTYHLHVFQWKGSDKLPLREGIGEWQGYLKKFTTPRTLLLEFMPDGRIETLSEEADSLRTIVGGMS
ncbi:MAG: sugar phosphate isomerase/epimerase [Clostridia bacterium]|nr:sugar phosphate isomerase/epimerase [Clostridia bacterium]